MRIRLTAVTALALVLAVMAASPATAATAITRARMVNSLLTANSFGDGWHKFHDSSSGEPTITGCEAFDYKSVGVKRDVDQALQFEKAPLFVAESIQSFGTAAQARADTAKGVNLFAKCATVTVDGKPWTSVRLTVPDYSDQQAMFRITGQVPTDAGDVSFTMFFAVSRHGRQQVIVMVTVAGNDIDAALRRDVAKFSILTSRRATAKVAGALGR